MSRSETSSQTPEVWALYARLAKRAKAVTMAEDSLEHERKGRDHVIRLLLAAGCSERGVAQVAGISNVAVHYIKPRSERLHRDKS